MNSDYKFLTVSKLKNLARQHRLSGYSRLNRNDLISLLSNFIPPKVEQSLESLPRDMQLEILSRMDLPELQKTCTSNKYFSQLCSQEQLWQQVIQRKYPDRPLPEISWKQAAINEYRADTLRPIISAFGGLGNFLKDQLSYLAKYLLLPEEERAGFYSEDPLADLTLHQDVDEANYATLEKFYQQDPPWSIPLPDLHYLIIEVARSIPRTSRTSAISSHHIPTYDVTLQDIANVLMRIIDENDLTSKNFLIFDFNAPVLSITIHSR